MQSGAQFATVVVFTPTGSPLVDEPAKILGVDRARRDLTQGWRRFTHEGDTWNATRVEPGFAAREYDLVPGPDLSDHLEALFAFAQRNAASGVEAVPQIRVDHTDSWAPSSHDALHFGTAASAKRLINVAPLYARNPPVKGGGVNVVVVDRGLHRSQIPAANYGGAWIRLPGGWGCNQAPPPMSPEVGRHGTMIARTILSIAPDAKIWELRAIPAPNEVIAGLGDIHTAYAIVHEELRAPTPPGPGPWIFVNPWGLFDCRLEAHIPKAVRYAVSRNNGFNLLMERFATAADTHYDLIFAAGNGGQFAPSRRQGPADRGPGCSILGANGHQPVLSVGAVRSDGIWLGYSSQGPSLLGAAKPDICAPSNFVETHDRGRIATGTSAASAVAAGVVALLRNWELANGRTPTTPVGLFRALRESAKRPPGAARANRTGAGIIDAEAARRLL